jgi:hypothetical protein
MIEKCANLGDNEIFRYRVFDDQMDWSYRKCRIQIKAMIRIIEKIDDAVVPLYCVTPEELDSIESGYCVPRRILNRRHLANTSLEDFALSPEESAVSKRSEELPDVLDYIETTKMSNMLPHESS